MKIVIVDGRVFRDNSKFESFKEIIRFSLNVFTEFCEFSDRNIFHYSKRARTCHPVTSCERPRCYHSSSQINVRDRIFKLTQIHASVIINLPEFAEFNEFLFHLGKTPVDGDFQDGNCPTAGEASRLQERTVLPVMSHQTKSDAVFRPEPYSVRCTHSLNQLKVMFN